MPPSVRWQLRPSSTSALAGRGGGNWDATCERCAAAAAKVSQQSTEVWRGSDGNKSHPPTEFPRQRVLSHLFPSRPSCLQSPGPSQLGQSRALEVHQRGHAGQRLHGSSRLPEVWGDRGCARVLGAVWRFPPIAVHMGSMREQRRHFPLRLPSRCPTKSRSRTDGSGPLTGEDGRPEAQSTGSKGAEPIRILGVTRGSQQLTVLESEVSRTGNEWQKHPVLTGPEAPCILGIHCLRRGCFEDPEGTGGLLVELSWRRRKFNSCLPCPVSRRTLLLWGC